MSRMCYGHQLIGQTKIQMSLIKAIPVIAAVIPGAVRLIPLSVQLHGIPGVSIIGIPCLAVFYSCCSKELCICTLIRLTCAKFSGQRTLSRRPFQGVIILKLVKQPVMQPKGFCILWAISFAVTLSYCRLNNWVNTRIFTIRYAYIEVQTQIIYTCWFIHHIKPKVISTGSSHGKCIIVWSTLWCIIHPLTATWIRYWFECPLIWARIARRIHSELIFSWATCCRHMECGRLSKYRIIPFCF